MSQCSSTRENLSFSSAWKAALFGYSRAFAASKIRREGSPDIAHVSTSFVERQNLTMQMHMRRFSRLTNAFSNKVENHAHAVALHMMY